MYNVLIIGGGGREHALAWKIKKSPKCGQLHIAPGNAGTLQFGQNLVIDVSDFKAVEAAAKEHAIDYIVVGPEKPLVDGIYDHFENHPNVKVIGPSAAAAQLEGSKSFANAFMDEFDIPTAGSLAVDQSTIQAGMDYIDAQKPPIVLKADGLAAGKGVLIIRDKAEAKTELQSMLDGKFGEASKTVVIEEFLDGIEFSVFVITDGKSYKMLPTAKDYKRIGEGDTGLNTGGMGAVSPVPFVDEALMHKVRSRIIEPTINGIRKRRYAYKGFIFFGLINVGGDPYVIEYNCRLGDPETEVILPRLDTDLVELFEHLYTEKLPTASVRFTPNTVATIMLVSGGYPGSYTKKLPILMPEKIEDSIVFHAGTAVEDGQLVTNGGRVLAVSSEGPDHQAALRTSLDTIRNISFAGMYYRKDIGFDL